MIQETRIGSAAPSRGSASGSTPWLWAMTPGKSLATSDRFRIVLTKRPTKYLEERRSEGRKRVGASRGTIRSWLPPKWTAPTPFLAIDCPGGLAFGAIYESGGEIEGQFVAGVHEYIVQFEQAVYKECDCPECDQGLSLFAGSWNLSVT